MRRLPFVTATVLWTFFVWGNRLSNIWRSDVAVGDQLGSVLLAAAMLGGAVAVAALAFRRHQLLGTVVTIFAVATVAVWGSRVIGILLGDWGVGFVVVHVLLALVSAAVVLAAVVEAIDAADDAAAPSAPGEAPVAPDSGTAGSAG